MRFVVLVVLLRLAIDFGAMLSGYVNVSVMSEGEGGGVLEGARGVETGGVCCNATCSGSIAEALR